MGTIGAVYDVWMILADLWRCKGIFSSYNAVWDAVTIGYVGLWVTPSICISLSLSLSHTHTPVGRRVRLILRNCAKWGILETASIVWQQ